MCANRFKVFAHSLSRLGGERKDAHFWTNGLDIASHKRGIEFDGTDKIALR